ncbi:fungal trichothecene efflux pump-domain-containing protein [Xylariales sp. AK1849]|nr:fungal trichothecene efflux pump-domain-containing protein [Xylariales sp. AK1849]
MVASPAEFEDLEKEYQHHPRGGDASSISSEALGDNLPKGYFYSPGFIGAMTGFCLSAISAYIFLILPTNVLTYINADIGPSAYISWVNIARTLALSFTYTILGRLSDLFGRRWFFIGGNAVALIGIIVCSVARNVNTLIIGSAVYGLGETVQLSFNVAVGELVPNKYRPMVLSFIFLSNAPIATFGPIIARKFIENTSLGWRWCYYINIIAVGLAVILLSLSYHPPTFQLLHERKSKKEMLKKLDYIGIFMWTAGLTLFLMGISLGGTIYPWKSAPVISTITIGAILLILLFVYETSVKLEYPAIPVKFFRNRGFMSLVCCATVASMFYYSAVLLWPQQVQALFTKDVTYAGWLSCTVASSTALGQVCAGAIVKWGGNVRYWLIFSTFAMVGFVAALASLTPATKNTGIALTILGPFFVGFIELASLALAPLFCEPADIGLASGLLASIRSAGGSVAVAVYSTILSNRLASTVPATIVPVAVAAGLPESQVSSLATAIVGGKLATFPGLTDLIKAAVGAVLPTAYSQAFKTVYLASLGFGAIAIVGCLFSKDAQKHLTDKVERKIVGFVTIAEFIVCLYPALTTDMAPGSVAAMRDRNKWTVQNLTEQVAFLTGSLDERLTDISLLDIRLVALEAENTQLRTQNAALQLSMMGRGEILQNLITAERTDKVSDLLAMELGTLRLKPNLASLLYRDERTKDKISNVVGYIVRSYTEIETLTKQVAVFYVMAVVFKWLVLLDKTSWDLLPDWLRPTPCQLVTSHAAWVERIPWPRASEYLVEHPEITLDDFASTYSSSFVVKWDYDPAHNFITTSSGDSGLKQVTTNPIYEEHIRQLKKWTVGDAFRNRFPNISVLIDEDIGVA